MILTIGMIYLMSKSSKAGVTRLLDPRALPDESINPRRYFLVTSSFLRRALSAYRHGQQYIKRSAVRKGRSLPPGYSRERSRFFAIKFESQDDRRLPIMFHERTRAGPSGSLPTSGTTPSDRIISIQFCSRIAEPIPVTVAGTESHI